MTATKQQPIAGYRISDPSDPTIKPWLSDTPDDNGYTSEPLYAGAAPAAVAGPAIDRAATLAAIDDISEPSWTGYECPNTWADGLSAARAVVQSAPAAPALEAPAAPSRTSVAVLQCDCCGHIGINDAADGKAACNTCRWTGDSPAEDKCPGCNRVGTMTTACPECGARTTLIAETHLQAPAALEAPAAPESAPWCPDVCPITGRPFFMWIDHWQTGKPVPTYGGPYDSYTIPVKDSDGSFECERYDHDEGGWLTEGAGWHCLGVRLVDDQSFVVDPSNPRYHEIEAFAAAAPQAPAAPSTHAGLLAAAAHIQAKAQAHLDERGSYDPDTGAVEMSDANQEHFNTLDELADEIRMMADKAAPASCDRPPAGWTCTRAPGHDGPCAAAPAAPAVDAKAHDWRENASYGGEICAECGAAKGSRRGNAPCAWPPEPLDVCTDPYNCARCKTHPAHRGDMHHAGISRIGGSA